MPLLRDNSIQNAARCPSTSTEVRIPYAPPARCAYCDCHLSKYREHDEILCAPCSRSGAGETTQATPSARLDRARDLLAEGLTFDQVAYTLGWSSGPTACKAIRGYEDQRGLSRAGRTRPKRAA